ncbi:hypothetical protein GGQ65_000615 [Rhizobium fabae]|uniref:Uncharacterized protein n=1 Tax=Rhizobium fabae TaxID=573179 RepID=A0A7W6B244_9HYPH|nr:hypothetical protein [Rhizobium fabae]
MTRTLIHSFDLSSASPITDVTVDLDVADIEVAGIREVVQTPVSRMAHGLSSTCSLLRSVLERPSSSANRSAGPEEDRSIGGYSAASSRAPI